MRKNLLFVSLVFICLMGSLGPGREPIFAKDLDQSVPSQKLSIAAASDLKFALDELVSEFSKLHPQSQIQVTYGSSGSLAGQLLQDAPFGLFFSADPIYIQSLEEKGKAYEGGRFEYGEGKLVLWTPSIFSQAERLEKPRKLIKGMKGKLRFESESSDPSVALRKEGLNYLLRPEVQKVAIANPKHAPYGRAAVEALRTAGIYDKVKDKLVFGENVAQAAQFAQSGAAQVGLIAVSLARSAVMRDSGVFMPVPNDLYTQIKQTGVVLKNQKGTKALAEQFKDFVLSSKGKNVLKQYGLGGN